MSETLIKGTMVLEGGATRGVFTAGILDFLMEKGLYLSHVIGVSMGACNASSYLSKQPGRMRNCMIHREKELGYYSNLRKLARERSVLDMDMLFDRYPNKLIPFDYDTFFASPIRFEAVVTNCETGEAEYMEEHADRKKLMQILRASSSMPVISPMVMIGGVPYLDGGLSDSIPIARAIDMGNEKIVVILTRNPGYRKKMPTKLAADAYRRAYRAYPELARTAIRRNHEYNKSVLQVRQMEREGKAFVLQPLIPTVSRLERDYDSLLQFYEHGYELMEERYDDLRRYLEL